MPADSGPRTAGAMVSIGKGFIIASPKRTTVGATIRCRSQAVSFYAILPDVWPKRNSWSCGLSSRSPIRIVHHIYLGQNCGDRHRGEKPTCMRSHPAQCGPCPTCEPRMKCLSSVLSWSVSNLNPDLDPDLDLNPDLDPDPDPGLFPPASLVLFLFVQDLSGAGRSTDVVAPGKGRWLSSSPLPCPLATIASHCRKIGFVFRLNFALVGRKSQSTSD